MTIATPKKKYPYNFIYTDGSYMTFEVTNDMLQEIKQAMELLDGSVIDTGVGLLTTKDLRFVVPLKEEKKVEPASVSADPDLPIEQQEYLKYLRDLEKEGYLGG